MIKRRLTVLRSAMQKEGIDLYYFNTSDYHLSEYVPEYFRTIEYYSGFTGSLATLLVSAEDAWLFVDGRYHTQADQQCLPYDIKIVKLGTQGALEPLEFIKKNYADKTIGLDGKRTSIRFAKELIRNGIFIKSIDIYSDLIENRAPLSRDPVYELPVEYTGLTRKRKIEMIRYVLKDRVHIINNLESIAYLLNLRGNDILHTPVFLAYLVFINNDVYLFTDLERFNEEILDHLYEDGVIIRPYASYYGFLESIRGKKILVDENKVNYETYLRITRGRNTIQHMRSIVEDMKAIKNPIEQRNVRMAHIYDGVAVLRFLMWLNSMDKSTLTEYEVKEKIDGFRKEYRANDLSFSSIVAYNENAALMHYAPDSEHSAKLDNKGILLFDTGGQYNEGTTDVTRTIALGETSDEIKKYFTLVLKSMFNLSELKFLKGLSGNQIDVLARKDLWELGVDYRCGTGHGVGYNLAVHESPPNIRYGKTENGGELAEIKPGMVFSDEPGVYFEGKYGIRCENLLLCVNDENNEYGQFLRFETLTMIPFDRNLIDLRYLDERTRRILNAYHDRVYETLLPYLNDEEANYLRKLTKEI
ncbi:MAG: aminopeptidase P family N-terminal domain-containing protein [Erysipelotrichaceae bacterium]|nr:aminopeptidase P family N-terminal domain-containing protein [Erysipelotrichaceae bacterium]